MKGINTILISAMCFSLTAQTMIIKTGDPCSGDEICKNLTTSQADYIAASDNDWIEITATELSDLDANLTGVSHQGESGASNDVTGQRTYSNRFSGTIPSNNYPFMIRYYAEAFFTTDISGARVKKSTSSESGYNNLGGILPNHSATSTPKHYYFVMKKPTYKTASANYMAMYTANARPSTVTGSPSSRYCSGDCASPNNAGHAGINFEWYYTPTKQW